MLPFTKAESWPNIGFRVTAGSSGTSLLRAAWASPLGLGIEPGAIRPIPTILHLSVSSRPPDSNVARLSQQWSDRLKRRIAWVEHADKMVAPIHRVWHEPVERREVVLALDEQRGISLLAHAPFSREATTTSTPLKVVSMYRVIAASSNLANPLCD